MNNSQGLLRMHSKIDKYEAIINLASILDCELLKRLIGSFYQIKLCKTDQQTSLSGDGKLSNVACKKQKENLPKLLVSLILANHKKEKRRYLRIIRIFTQQSFKTQKIKIKTVSFIGFFR